MNCPVSACACSRPGSAASSFSIALPAERVDTIGLHGVWTPETARQEAKIQLGRVARGDNPSEERQLDHQAMMVKELCTLYTNDLKAGLILGKGGRPKKKMGTDI